MDLGIRSRAARALDQGRPDRVDVLEARVMIGDDQDVAALDTRAAHVVTLGGVAIAVGAEEHQHLARGHAADGGQGLLEGVGGVPEVDVDGGAAIARHALGASGQIGLDAAIALERTDQPVPVVSGFEHHHDGETRIGGHVPSDHRDDRGQGAPLRAMRDGTRCRSVARRGSRRPSRRPPRRLASAAMAGVPTVTNGISQRATTSADGAESSEITARRARSGRNRGSFASKYSRMSA